jgi:AraC-like DNA-binding protein/mannose-6-phosphate isomerase-like protein (cupin superfamily)
MQNYIIKTDESGQELIDHGDTWLPVAGYDEYFSKFVLNEVPWHWHEEIEFIIIYEGSIKVEYVDGYTNLDQGDGIFINSNTLHRLTQIGNIDCHIINFVLKPEFLGGRYDSRIYREYIKPICNNKALSTIKLSPTIPWGQKSINKIIEAFNAFTSSTFGYEMVVRTNLTEVWGLICINQPNVFKNSNPITESRKRISKIIKFIHNNYENKLTIRLLAGVADISESECYRLFKKTLQTTPNDYILNHRLQVAAIKLVDSDETILNLTYELGFGSPSYFSKKFKERYSYTPRKFRHTHQLRGRN